MLKWIRFKNLRPLNLWNQFVSKKIIDQKQKQPPKVLCKKVFLKIYLNSQESTGIKNSKHHLSTVTGWIVLSYYEDGKKELSSSLDKRAKTKMEIFTTIFSNIRSIFISVPPNMLKNNRKCNFLCAATSMTTN